MVTELQFAELPPAKALQKKFEAAALNVVFRATAFLRLAYTVESETKRIPDQKAGKLEAAVAELKATVSEFRSNVELFVWLYNPDVSEGLEHKIRLEGEIRLTEPEAENDYFEGRQALNQAGIKPSDALAVAWGYHLSAVTKGQIKTLVASGVFDRIVIHPNDQDTGGRPKDTPKPFFGRPLEFA